MGGPDPAGTRETASEVSSDPACADRTRKDPHDSQGPAAPGSRASGLLGPTEVRGLCQALGIRPTKTLGQNFVHDAGTVRRIVKSAGVHHDDTILEIGPGLGSLTLALLETGARVIAVEIDPLLARALPVTVADRMPQAAGRLSVIEADALSITGPEPLGEAGAQPPTRLVANLPYNVAVPVLLTVLEALPSLETITVMVQAEVADRLAAAPGSRTYGAPSAKVAWYSDARRGAKIGRSVFWPVPNVDSALVSFIRHPPPSCVSRNEVFAVVDAAFAQRRKTLRSALAAWAGSPARAEGALRSAGIDPALRGERLRIEDFAAIAAADPVTDNVHLDWTEKAKGIRIDLDKDKLKRYGLSAKDVKQMLYTEISGAQAAEFYTGDRTIGIALRLAEPDRTNIERLGELPVATSGGYIPLAQIAHISYEAEDGFIKRLNLRPSILVQAEVTQGEGNDAARRIFAATKELRDRLPVGTTVETAGALADSADSMSYLVKPVPAMIFIIMTLLMIQVGSMGKMTLTILTAPLGLIGVVLAMLLTDSAVGFVAYLGILALFGMIIRNSVILIDQIKKHEEAGEQPMDAIIDSAVLRFRPIMLTAAAAILGMLPLMRSIFWGPMAVAIAGGLIVATVLTLLVLPVMYAVAYRVKN